MHASEIEQLLLRAALLDGDAALAAWDRARRQPGCIDEAPYRVLPQLYRNLVELGVDDAEMGRLKGVYLHSWSQNQQLLAEGARVLERLRDAGVETIVLGGAATDGLAIPIERLELLVRTADAHRAAAALESAGTDVERRVRTGEPIVLERPGGQPVALRTSPFWEPVAEEPVWQLTRSIELAGVKTLALDPTHDLMRACTGGLAVTPALARWIPDAASAIGEAVDWDLLADHAEQWSMTARLEAALETLSVDFGRPVPPAVLERLRGARRTRHERAAHAVGSRPPGRGAHHVLQWHRHRGLRAVRPDLAGAFPDYWRASLGADGWGAVARRYLRRVNSPRATITAAPPTSTRSMRSRDPSTRA